MVASEATPLVKVGGLADVVGALPDALRALGHDVRILLPRYGVLQEHGYTDTPTGIQQSILWKNTQIAVELYSGNLPGSDTQIYTLGAGPIFAGGAYVQDPSPEGFRAQMERFTFFSWATAQILPHLDWQPDVIHCHDWHSAGVPVFLKLLKSTTPTVITIHNIESQGKWGAAELFSWIGLRGNELSVLQERDQAGDFNLLQQAIFSADAVTTVSPTYAKELLDPMYGCGLEKTLRERVTGVTGIVNGIDTRRFDPASDTTLRQRYTVDTVRTGKKENRQDIEKLCNWNNDLRPILGVVSRLTAQKGLELLLEALPVWLTGGGRLVVLGTGQPELEQRLMSAAQSNPESVFVKIGFDAVIAQKIYGGADFFAMPSKFEPCGLGQLIAMRYGCLPIVRDTGGLHDTVRDIVRDPKNGTGFVFADFSKTSLEEALWAALRLWEKPDILETIQQRAMRQDFSWAASANAYTNVYAAIKK